MHTNSRNSRRPILGATRAASLCALLMNLACGGNDSQALPEAQTRAAPASEQALLQKDLVITEDVKDTTHSYVATLPPSTLVGTISQTLEASWSPNLFGIHQAPRYPQGWSIEYYEGSTKLASEPATADAWAKVSRVATSGATEMDSLDGERQAIISSVASSFTEVASTFKGNRKGDGWDVFFDPAYTRVFNIHHHNEPATVMCRNLADTSTCPGFPIDLTQTSNLSTGHIDAASNKLWQPTVTLDNKLAWDCVDLTTSERCATPVVFSEYAASGSDKNNHMTPVVLGRKMYALGAAQGGVARITCLDMATGAECAGMELPESGIFYQGGIAAVRSRLYVLPGLNKHLDCYDSTTWKRCAGEWPKAVTIGPVWAVNGADGTVQNVCASNKCFGLDGSAHTLPPNFAASLKKNAPEESATSLGTKAAWRSWGYTAHCWNMATDTQCASQFPIVVENLYTTTLDPELPNCLWTNNHKGIIENWDTRTGNLGCTVEVSHIRFKAETGIPRLSCDPASRVYQYKSFKLTSPAPSEYTSATLTVKNSQGGFIPGWIDRPFSSDATVDLTQLSPDATGDSPTFDVAVTGLKNTLVEPSGTFRVTTGAPPQLCWELSESSLVCPNKPGLALPQEALVTTKGSFATSAGTTSFTDQVMKTSVKNPPDFNNCGGAWLRATVVSLSDGSPISGQTVFLLDSAGNPILDANGLPASAVSAADGTLEFSVWAGGYTLKLTGDGHYTPVSMNVDAGGSGTTQASEGTVVSNTITPQRQQPAHVTITVDVVPVLDEAWFQGSGCASSGGAQPVLMVLLALGGLWGLRRRRA
jgi:MYXO-CTERM domain-containing protein